MVLRDVLGVGAGDVEVTSLAYDNRSVRPGALFFCVEGLTRDGHDFAPDAVARGAGALVVTRPLGLGVPEVRVPDVRVAMARAAAAFHGDPTARLPVVGITGTNGKTTSTFLLRGLLERAGRPCGLLGTVASVVAGERRPVERTTPEAIELQRTFAEMVAGGDRACAMEVSSHALALHRADGIHFAARVFTNLTQDHLDFHGGMEDYFAAKRLLFATGTGTRIVNTDDPYGRRLAREHPDAVTVGVESRDAAVRAERLRAGHDGTRFDLVVDGRRHPVLLPLPGRFNVLNALGAWAAARALGLPEDVLARGLADAERVPGRFEPVDLGQPFSVVVDYAHTPDGLENVLRAARELAEGRVVVVFGAGGDRDRAKRPLMGEIAARLADLAIITSDNPRSEDPEAIVAAVAEGAGPGAQREVDRRRAIHRAIELALPGDVVVVAGKGHELGQEFAGGRKEPFDDVAVARDALRAARRGARG